MFVSFEISFSPVLTDAKLPKQQKNHKTLNEKNEKRKKTKIKHPTIRKTTHFSICQSNFSPLLKMHFFFAADRRCLFQVENFIFENRMKERGKMNNIISKREKKGKKKRKKRKKQEENRHFT